MLKSRLAYSIAASSSSRFTVANVLAKSDMA
jgi:hypothetical protein